MAGCASRPGALVRAREEQILERHVLARLGQRDDLMLMTNEVGEGYYGAVAPLLRGAVSRFGPEAVRAVNDVLYRQRVTYGLCVGSSDLVAVAAPLGRLVAIELKSERGELRPAQRAWLQRMRELGAVAGEARSPDEAEALVDAAGRVR